MTVPVDGSDVLMRVDGGQPECGAAESSDNRPPDPTRSRGNAAGALQVFFFAGDFFFAAAFFRATAGLRAVAARAVRFVAGFVPVASTAFGAAEGVFPAVPVPAALFAGAFRPHRPLRSGAAARIAWHSSSASDFGSRSVGILPFFFPSVMYGP